MRWCIKRCLYWMNFCSKWIDCIWCCLKSSSSSILVNGSPIEEFSIHRGLRQGVLLEPFYFWLWQRVCDVWWGKQKQKGSYLVLVLGVAI